MSAPKPSTNAVGKQEPPVDYQILLLALAEEYISNARSLSQLIVRTRQEAETQRYYKLLATGLGCIDSVLKVG